MILSMMNNDKKIDVRDKILLTAHDLFYSKGFRATGVDKIIKEAKVTKVTFYRYYPGKKLLILAYLDYRHKIWTTWFFSALMTKIDAGNTTSDALSQTLYDWFICPSFRGCAFINATAEAESEDIAEEIKEICRNHKLETEQQIASLFGITTRQLSYEVMMLIDGAIIHAQMGMHIDKVIGQFKTALERLL